jgi:hypothetical protein
MGSTMSGDGSLGSKSRTRDAISEEKKEWGVWEAPVREDCLRLVVPVSTAEISKPKVQNWRAEWGKHRSLYLEGWRYLRFHDPSSWTSTELEIISISFASSSPMRLVRIARIRGSIPLRTTAKIVRSALLNGRAQKALA